MKKLVFILLVGIASPAFGQIPQEILDSFASKIRALHLSAEGLYLSNGNQTISYPQENFGVMVHSRLAYYSVYFISSSSERLEINENIDLSKVTAIETQFDGDLGIVKLTFAGGTFDRLIFENRLFKGRTSENQLKLIFNGTGKEKENRRAALFKLLTELCHLVKEERKYLRPQEARFLAEQWEEVSKAVYPQGIQIYSQFLKDYPHTLYTNEAKRILNEYNAKKEVEIRLQKEAAQDKARIYALMNMGDKADSDFGSYYKAADSLAGLMLNRYPEHILGSKEYVSIKNMRNELSERMRWNEEYFGRIREVHKYVALASELEASYKLYQRRLRASGGLAFDVELALLGIGSVATGIGIAKFGDQEGSGGARVNGFLYGGITALGIAGALSLLHARAEKQAYRKFEKVRMQTEEMKQKIEPILEKRRQIQNGQLLLNFD